MNNDIVQLTDKSGNNIYPIAGGATQDSISKSMLAEGVFEGPELFPSPNEAYVRTANIVDGAVTSDKIDWTTLGVSTTEQVIGQYDNKPLYRKAIIVPSNSNTSVSIDTGVAIDKLLSVSANMHISTGNDDNWVGTFYGSATDFFRYFLRKFTSGTTHALEIRIGSGNAANSPDYIVVLEYTK